MPDAQTKKEEKVEQKFFAQQAKIPVKNEKEPKEEKPVKTPQDEFNDKLRELSKTVLELADGGSDVKSDYIEKVVHDTLKFAHGVKYSTSDKTFDPITPPIEAIKPIEPVVEQKK